MNAAAAASEAAGRTWFQAVQLGRYRDQLAGPSRLTDEVAMSRSAFAARFTALVGEPPMRYVARWRMQVAQTWLEEGAALGELAYRLGYQSEAAFSRAFKRFMGVPPGAVRRGDDVVNGRSAIAAETRA